MPQITEELKKLQDKELENLHSAISKKDEGEIEKSICTLVDLKFDFNQEVGLFVSCLHQAVRMSQEGLIRVLLEKKINIDVAKKSRKGRSIWAAAVLSRDPISTLKILSEIAEKLPSLKEEIDACDHYGRTALHSAVEETGSAECVEILLALGADPNKAKNPLLLHIAVTNNNKEIVKLLLNSGVVVNFRDIGGHEPLDIVKQNNTHVNVQNEADIQIIAENLKLFKGNDDDIEITEKNLKLLNNVHKRTSNRAGVQTAIETVLKLFEGIKLRDLDQVKEALEGGAYVQSKYYSYNEGKIYSSIELAADRSRPDIIKLIIGDCSCDQLVAFENGFTYILNSVFLRDSHATRNDKEIMSIINIFLDKGIDIDKVDPNGKKAINYALKHDFWKPALLLLCQHWKKSSESFRLAVKGALMGDERVTRRENLIKIMEEEAGQEILRKELGLYCTFEKTLREELGESYCTTLFKKISEPYLEKLQNKPKNFV